MMFNGSPTIGREVRGPNRRSRNSTANSSAPSSVLDGNSAGEPGIAERLIGSILRECLDHVIVANERGMRRVLHAYVEYYRRSRTHLSLDKDAPVSRPAASQTGGEIVAIPHLCGLHHRYERRAG